MKKLNSFILWTLSIFILILLAVSYALIKKEPYSYLLNYFAEQKHEFTLSKTKWHPLEPYIEIEINETGGIGRVVSHEGRHRVTTIKALNSGTTKIPVAVRFKRTGDPEAYKKNRTGRSDVRNKTFLANYLSEGLLVTQGGTTESGAISNMMGKKVYEKVKVY